jgi:CubicO group peptidase (beta-lactamase class C family)
MSLLIRRKAKAVVLVLIATLAVGASAQQLATVAPEQVGLSSDRFSRLDQFMQTYVDENKLAGIVMLIARHGKIAHLSTLGKMRLETGAAMQTDSIFRLHSMTKPITSVALLMLYEEGRFQLTDQLEMYIPAFRDLKVFSGLDDAGEMVLVEQQRKMTIHDLFRHTAGLAYNFADTPIDKAYEAAGINDTSLILTELVEKLGTMPLLYQPGSRWVYSYAHDVQAYLVEHFSGMPFDEFLRTRLFEPLGMKDTSFGLTKDKLDRFTTSYKAANAVDTIVQFTPLEPGLVPVDEAENSDYLKRVDNPAGGTGLVSTAEDYFRFSQMLLNGGEFNGTRILGRKTVALMTKDHIPPGADRGLTPPGGGYGLGVSVLVDDIARGNIASPGEYGWAGYATTFVIIDPVEDMVSIFMTQYQPVYFPIREQFVTLVYQALVD